ncbi:MAG: pilus assembly protein [Candidatus Dormibacteraeota bacterium]|nr:pilus assembly protein [Candidatus Dormibacteraeota bacterium]
MTEFALVAPVLLLLTFGIIDFGRALYFYVTAGAAAREGARIAIRASNPLPSNIDVTGAVASHLPGFTVVPATCVNGPLPGGGPASGAASIYVTEPNPVSSLPSANAPGGEAAAPSGACNTVTPATGYQYLQVTVVFAYSPVTPLVSNVIGNRLVFRLGVIARTEY